MTAFDDRERAFEAKFAHDEETQFRTQTRALRLTAEWAAALIGRTGPAADEYVREVLHQDVQRAGHEAAIARLEADLSRLLAPGDVRAALAANLRSARAEALADV